MIGQNASAEEFFNTNILPRIQEIGLDLQRYASFGLPGPLATDIATLRTAMNTNLNSALAIRTSMAASLDANLKRIRETV